MLIGHRVAVAQRWIAAVLLLLLLLATPGLSGVSGQSPSPDSPPFPSIPLAGTLTTSLAASLIDGTPRSSPAALPAAASPVVATPTAQVACTDPCLVRFEASLATMDALARTGMRPSLTTDIAVWVGGTPADLALLVARGVEPLFIMDATPSLMLYAVTQPSGDVDRGLVEAFGTVLDQDGLTSIVEVPSVPAAVVDLTTVGFRVQKLTPYVPAGTPLLSADGTASLPDVTEVTETFPDLSTSEIERSIRDLASTGVEPGQPGSRFFSLPGNAIAAEYLFLRFAAYGLAVWFEDFVASTGILSVNVVAEIPGTDPSQIYAAFAHFDTISEDVPGNDEAPGALDNGTGLAVLLENARVLADYRLHYPLRFVALGVEEIGPQAATAFGTRHVELGTPFAGGINIDSVGTAYGERRLVVNAGETSAFIQTVLLEQYDAFGFDLNILPRQNPVIISDETPLTEYGIPTILVASVLFGDPLINCSCDTIDGVDLDYVRATGRLVLLTVAVLTSRPA